jgi:hypothetical protein
LHVNPHVPFEHEAVAFAGALVHGVVLDTKRQPFPSVEHVPAVVPLSQIAPVFPPQSGSLLQLHVALPTAPVHVSCVAHDDAVPYTKQPVEGLTWHEAICAPTHSFCPLEHASVHVFTQPALGDVPWHWKGRVHVAVLETKRQPFASALHVATLPVPSQTLPAWVQLGSLTHVQTAVPPASAPASALEDCHVMMT